MHRHRWNRPFIHRARCAVFNSDRSGIPQIHVARVREGLLEGL